MLKIIVDAMGGDNAPAEIVKGAVEALADRGDFKIILTGDEALVRRELDKYSFDASRVELVPCSQVITNDDVPTSAVRSKRDSSLVVGLNILKNDVSAGGFVSAGSTGAVLTGGIMFIGRIKGVMRPALCPGIPNVRGTQTLLCDCGANAECKPAYLAQFGVMASAYARAAYGVKEPKVGLLTNGTEEHKGDPLHQEAFSGNVALKAIEGCGKTVGEMLKQQFTASLGAKLSYLFARKPIKGLANALDYSRFGGSVFLGLKKVVVKSHGSSKAKSIKPSVYQALDACRGGLIGMMEEMLGATEQAGEDNA